MTEAYRAHLRAILDQIRAEALASDVAGSIHDALGSGAAPSG